MKHTEKMENEIGRNSFKSQISKKLLVMYFPVNSTTKTETGARHNARVIVG